ncbi:MAG: VacJ family lipoprotein [Alphaproteobacteria bacterium]|nr:VacJ family lipoprotein [Alphaproteobacteria bacterium]
MVNQHKIVNAADAPGHPTHENANEVKDGKVIDQLEEDNRARYFYNQSFDRNIGVPLAKAYRIVPKNLRIPLRSFMNNLGIPFTFANHILQGNFTWAVMDVGRFAINSTIGFAGLCDIAGPAGLPKNSSDFGITLGVWGVGPGPYLHLPLFGPSTTRDSLGMVLEIATPNPVKDALNFNTAVNAGLGFARYLDIRESLIEPLELMQANAIDPYTQMKSFYLQGREAAVRRAIIGPKADLMSKSGAGYGFGKYSGQGKPANQSPQLLPGSGDPAWQKDKDDN